MTRTVGVHEAKTHLSRLLREVQNGDEIVLTRDGAPVARIVGVEAPASPGASYGLFAGQIRVGEDLDVDGDELADAFGIAR